MYSRLVIEKLRFKVVMKRYVQSKSSPVFFQPDDRAKEISQKGAKFVENIFRLKSIPEALSGRNDDFYADVLSHATNFIQDPSTENFKKFKLSLLRLEIDYHFFKAKLLREAFIPAAFISGIMGASLTLILAGILALTVGTAVAMNPVGLITIGLLAAVVGTTLIVTNLYPYYKLHRDSKLDDFVAFYDCLNECEDFNKAFSTDTSLLAYRIGHAGDDGRGIIYYQDDSTPCHSARL
ncbi:hypothetical protein Lnau_0376 [Legionella nautarum]|uniref:Uncharacterized protein n=1 Tax=Legionella nautarum TaxID=45070 RepID=A0A0W0X2V6_9GAMM|nr:hypothetical protein [Legionella nautarum]KTD38882.1 hypothetical protein Lnau_0376 [Legionella nautarum]